MKKLALAVVAVSALAVIAPSIASARAVIIQKHGHHDRDWHHGHKKIVVIKHGHH